MIIKKITKGKIQEIIDFNGDIIGINDSPENGANLETNANKTTDYNAQVHGQNFKNDFLGRFGFYFYEGEEEKPTKVVDELAHVMYDRYVELVNYYHDHPEELERDFQLNSQEEFDTQSEEIKQISYDWAKKAVDILEPYLSNVEETNTLNEEAVAEDKILEKKTDNDISTEKVTKDVLDKKIALIADKLNKLKKDDLNKLINLLEKK